MEKIYNLALIEAGAVSEVILCTAPDWPAKAGLPGQWIDLTDMQPQPGPGWTYARGVFAAPKSA